MASALIRFPGAIREVLWDMCATAETAELLQMRGGCFLEVEWPKLFGAPKPALASGTVSFSLSPRPDSRPLTAKVWESQGKVTCISRFMLHVSRIVLRSTAATAYTCGAYSWHHAVAAARSVALPNFEAKNTHLGHRRHGKHCAMPKMTNAWTSGFQERADPTSGAAAT